MRGLRVTPREGEILDLVAAGLTTKEIARRLDLSRHTVGKLLERLFARNGLHSRTEAVARWISRVSTAAENRPPPDA